MRRRLAGTLLRTACAAVAVFAASVAGTALVGAQTAPDPVVHGCYGADRLLRIVEAADGCRQGETPLHWPREGIAGRPGPDGETGPRGEAGATGPTGADGADGRPLSLSEAAASRAGRGRQAVVARCANGSMAVAGSWSASVSGPVSVTASGPLQGAAGWRVAARAPGEDRWTLSVTALCLASTQSPPRFAAPADARRPRPGCTVACAHPTIARSSLLRDGVPLLVVARAARTNITATVTTPRGAVVARALRRGAPKGAVKVPVAVGASGRRRLASRAQTRLRVRVRVTSPGADARTVVLPLVVEGDR